MDVFEEIRTILAEILDVEKSEVTAESSLLQELGAESIDLLELAAALNSRFRVEINEDDIFLRSLGRRLQEADESGKERALAEEFPFLSPQRIAELTADPEAGPVLKVKDLAGYVTWRLKRA